MLFNFQLPPFDRLRMTIEGLGLQLIKEHVILSLSKKACDSR